MAFRNTIKRFFIPSLLLFLFWSCKTNAETGEKEINWELCGWIVGIYLMLGVIGIFIWSIHNDRNIKKNRALLKEEAQKYNITSKFLSISNKDQLIVDDKDSQLIYCHVGEDTKIIGFDSIRAIQLWQDDVIIATSSLQHLRDGAIEFVINNDSPAIDRKVPVRRIKVDIRTNDIACPVFSFVCFDAQRDALTDEYSIKKDDPYTNEFNYAADQALELFAALSLVLEKMSEVK